MPFSKRVKHRFRELGGYFGFPPCCINAFVRNTALNPRFNRLRADAGDGTGFLPCVKHARMVLAGKATLESLIKGRKCKQPFPHGEAKDYATD